MILKGAAAARYLAAPDPARAGLLVWGADGARVALARQDAVAALAGPGAEDEMRIARLTGDEVRRDPAALDAAMRAAGFFPGQRVVVVEGATDGTAPAFAAALAAWAPGDAVLVATGGELAARSALRAAFEGSPRAVAVGLYDEPATAEDVAAELSRAGLGRPPPETAAALLALARALDPGDFRQTVEKLALYKHGDPAPLTPAEVEALAPQTLETGADELVAATVEGREPEVVQLMRRALAQGMAPVSLCLAAERHLRALHAMACDPAGPETAMGRLRPPPRWALRTAMLGQTRRWRRDRLEQALRLMLQTDAALRASPRVPALALVERALLRVARLARG